MRPRSYEDLTGKTFFRLTVVKPVTVNRRTKWECKCSCGETKIVDGLELINGHVKSCGCLHKDAMAERAKKSKTYGYTHHRLYACYYRMRHRCENAADGSYKRYGGRGIKVCDEWKNDIMAFINWGLENGYKEGLSIDRIDNDGDYSPENCRWADARQQSNNRHTNKYVSYNGETHTVSEWSRIIGISPLTLNARLSSGWNVEDALTISTDERRYGILQNANVKTIVYKDGEIVGVFDSQSEAAQFVGVGKSSVSRCMRGLQSQAKGYVFKPYEEAGENNEFGKIGVGSTGRR